MVLAGPKDQEAKQLAEQAVFTDYLGTHFDAAKTKLERAVALCADPNACSPDVKANVHRDLGVVLIAGLGDTPGGKAQFVLAFQANPAVALDPDLATESVTAAFEEARASAGAPEPTAAPPVPPAPPETAVAAPPPAPAQTTPQPGAQPPPPTAQNQAPAAKTAMDAEVCPPDFPGCEDNSAGGAYCESDLECAGGRICVHNECTEPTKPTESALNWLTVAVQQDSLFLRRGKRMLCASDDYSCYDKKDQRFTGETGGFKGGAVLGTTRVILGFDRALLPFLTVGFRAGFAFLGAPEDFVPLHAEGRAAYWLGNEPLTRPGLRPYFFLGGGVGEIDGKIKVKDGGGAEHNAWRQAGLNFVAVGPGLVYAFTEGFGVLAEAKGEVLFPSTQFGASLQLGATLGF